MLEIEIPDRELFDERTEEFITIKGRKIVIEHSLVSLSKWEAKYKKPFMSSEKNASEVLDYIKFMTITQNVDKSVYDSITPEILEQVINYIEDPMTATWFNEREQKKSKSKETVTAEIIYYWMIALQIPMECQKWHLNRLLTLIRVCSLKNAPDKKMSKKELLARNRQLNAARRARTGSKG